MRLCLSFYECFVDDTSPGRKIVLMSNVNGLFLLVRIFLDQSQAGQSCLRYMVLSTCLRREIHICNKGGSCVCIGFTLTK